MKAPSNRLKHFIGGTQPGSCRPCSSAWELCQDQQETQTSHLPQCSSCTFPDCSLNSQAQLKINSPDPSDFGCGSSLQRPIAQTLPSKMPLGFYSPSCRLYCLAPVPSLGTQCHIPGVGTSEHSSLSGIGGQQPGPWGEMNG